MIATGHILLPMKDTRTEVDTPLPACIVLNLFHLPQCDPYLKNLLIKSWDGLSERGNDFL